MSDTDTTCPIPDFEFAIEYTTDKIEIWWHFLDPRDTDPQTTTYQPQPNFLWPLFTDTKLSLGGDGT